MSSKKPKVKKYDPSKYEASLQNKKMSLSQSINDKALSTQKSALDESQKGIKDLYDGIGLFSAYMDRRTDLQNDMASIYGDGYQGLLSQYGDIQNETKKITDGIVGNYNRSMF